MTSCSRGRGPVQARSLAGLNPTTYSFPLPLEDVHARGIEAFSTRHQAQQPIFGRSSGAVSFEKTLLAECSTNAVRSKTIFSDPANTNDFYLHTWHTPFVASPVYHGRSGGLPFVAAFHLHLTAADSTTVVAVRALDAEVINGEKFSIGPCGPGYAWAYQKVKPTTVEEYLILRYLGRYLGVTNMPDVILPGHG